MSNNIAVVTNRKKESFAKALEVLGGLLLLASFITQNYVYDRWDGRTKDLTDAITAQALVGKSIPLNEILYVVWQNDGSLTAEQNREARLFKLREAVRKRVYAQIIPMAVSDLPRPEATALIQQMQAAGNGVHDLATYVDFIAVVNGITTAYKQAGLEVQHAREARDRWRERFLAAYIVGSLLLLTLG